MLAALALLLSPLGAHAAEAASFDPKWRWHTLVTEHFSVTYHDGEDALAREAAAAVETAYGKLTVELDTHPRERIRVMLVDYTDAANGSASIIPHDTIVIYVTAPGGDSELGLYEDWNEAVLTHELTHILHLDTVEGLPRVGRWVFGSVVSTQLDSPAWITEGFATFQETRQTHAGRGRSAVVDMVKRAAVLQDNFPPLGNLEGYQVRPPSGNLRYLFGQDFMQFIADKTGEDKWTEWVHRYGASIPYFLPARRTFGESFVKLYFEWKEALRQRYAAQEAAVTAEGLTPYTTVSPDGQGCGAPAYSPDGQKLLYSCYDYRRGPMVWLAGPDGAGAKIVLKRKYAKDPAFRPDGTGFVYSTSHTDDLYYVHNDVYLYDLGKKSLKQLTNGARASAPTFSPDGARLLAVTEGLQQTQLTTLTIDQHLAPLTQASHKEQFAWPRYSPDGTRIAVSVWAEGRRDLWLYATDGTPLRQLTADTAIEREPAWSADGRWLYFTSDRSGIPNIYALEVESDHLWQVTNVVIGASNPAPSPDGKRLAFDAYTTHGDTIAVMPLDPASFRDRGLLPILPAPAGVATTTTPSTATTPPTTTTTTPSTTTTPPDVHPYSPWSTLFPPTFWEPGALLTTTGQGYGAYLDAYTGGVDTLGYLSWSAYGTWRTDANFIGGGGSITLNRWRPVFSLGATTYVSPYSDTYVYTPTSGGGTLPSIEDSLTRYWDHRIRLATSMWYPLDSYSGLSVYARGESRQPLDPLPDNVYLAGLPTRGWFTSVGVGWSRADTESYPLSISTERGRSLAFGVEYTPSWAGSYTYDSDGAPVAFNQLQATGEVRQYLKNPWVPNHVLALRLSAGASFGDAFRYGSFRLGGYWSEGGITVVPDEWRPLRGFYPASTSGEWYGLGSAEYRFPLWNIDRGVGTFPVFARFLSGAVFADVGNAFDKPEAFDPAATLLGVGAELRVYAIIGYGYGIYGRLGYAFAAYGDGIPLGDPAGFYATVGSSF